MYKVNGFTKYILQMYLDAMFLYCYRGGSVWLFLGCQGINKSLLSTKFPLFVSLDSFLAELVGIYSERAATQFSTFLPNC